jgi:hypothetical protein
MKHILVADNTKYELSTADVNLYKLVYSFSFKII